MSAYNGTITRWFGAYEARDAVVILQRETGEAFKFWVDFEYSNPIEESRLEFDEFITALQENLCIQYIGLGDVHFDQANDSLLERLFGQVLPSHRSLTSIKVQRCRIGTEYVALFAASLAANRGQSLGSLDFEFVPLDPQGVAALANNLLQANSPIEELRLLNCDIDSYGCQTFFQALSGNTHLRSLELQGNSMISDISLVGVQALSRSNLRALNLSCNRLTAEAILNLVEGLRMNFSLEDLTLYNLGPGSPLSSDVFEELLAKYNFTLRRVLIFSADHPSQQRLNGLSRLNDRVRSAHNSLENLHHNYHVPQQSLWPDILERISSKPSLLYRFVRQGNLNAFANQMLLDPYEGLRRSRRRKRPMQRYNPSG